MGRRRELLSLWKYPLSWTTNTLLRPEYPRHVLMGVEKICFLLPLCFHVAFTCLFFLSFSFNLTILNSTCKPFFPSHILPPHFLWRQRVVVVDFSCPFGWNYHIQSFSFKQEFYKNFSKLCKKRVPLSSVFTYGVKNRQGKKLSN